MAQTSPSEYLIDTGGLDILLGTREESIVRFWDVLAKQRLHHAVSDVVYWEFLRQYDSPKNDRKRQRFVKAMDRGRIVLLPFDRKAADIAIRLYHGIRSRLTVSKSDRRTRMNALQCDIMIAAVAVRNAKIVVTDDLDDWGLLRQVAQDDGIGRLPLISKDDMRDPKKWKFK